MAWKVYGFMEPNDYSRAAGGYIYGPLPCKRWVRDVPRKKQKLNYKFHYSQRGGDTADRYNERRAIDYARWLARRDGIAIPPQAEARVIWDGFYSASKTRGQRHWDGQVRKHASYCRRIRAVEFGRKYREEHYNTRANGKRGAWLYTTDEMEVAAKIEIPNWNWEPMEPVEDVDLLQACAA